MGLFSSIAGPLVGSAVSSLFSSKGNKKANSQFQPGFSRSEPVIHQPKPFSLDTIFGNTTGGNFAGSNTFQALGQQSGILAQNLGTRAGQVDPQAFASRFLESMNRVNDKREAQGFASLESKLFNRVGASTGTARQLADFRNDIEDRRFGRGIQAEQLGMQAQYNSINNFINAMGGFRGLQQGQLDQTKVGFEGVKSQNPFSLGQRTTQQGMNNFAANNTKNFWDGLGGTIGGGIEAGISAFGGGGNSFSNNPFNGSGPQLSFQNAQAPSFDLNAAANAWRGF